jgi:microcystin-dependent protein
MELFQVPSVLISRAAFYSGKIKYNNKVKMSNPPNGYNTDPSFNKFKGTYYNDDIDVSGGDIISRTGNLYLAPNSSIYTSSNQIQFNEEFQFTDFIDNVNVLGQLKNTYNSVEYDVGLQVSKVDDLVSDVATLEPIVSDTAFKCTNFYYDQALNSTIFSNNVSFGNGTIASIAINNSDNRYVDIASAQTISGAKTFSSTPVFPVGSIPINRVSGTAMNLNGAQSVTSTKSYSVVQNFNNNIRLDGSLLLSAGTITLTNADLQKIAFLNTATSNIQTQISTINTNLSGYASLSADNTFLSPINTFNNTLNLNGSLKINNTLIVPQSTLFKLEFLQNVTSDIQNQINNINGVSLSASNVFTAQNQFTNNIRLDGSLIVNNNTTTLTNDNLNRIQYLSGVSSSVSTSLTNLNTSISTLNTKTTKISYMSVAGINTTTILDGLISQTFSFTGSINNINPTVFGHISGLTSSAQTQISNLATKLTAISYSGTTTTISNSISFTGTLNNISTTVFGYLSGLQENIKMSLDNLSARILTFEIVGTIIMSPLNDLQTTTSNKYLMCNGQAVSRTTYSALFAKFGELFGVGNGSTTFGLPNYNGMFLRGMGNQIINNVNYGNYNSTYAPDPDSIQNHTHSGQAGAYLGTNNTLQSVGYMASLNYAPASYSFTNTGNMSTGRINDFETKPVSIGIYYYVRT